MNDMCHDRTYLHTDYPPLFTLLLYFDTDRVSMMMMLCLLQKKPWKLASILLILAANLHSGIGNRILADPIGEHIVNVVTVGDPRTATTLQFNAVCASFFLHLLNTRPELATNLECKFDYGHPELYRENEAMPQVHKTHLKMAGMLKEITTKDTTWIFTTARTKMEAAAKEAQLTEQGYHVGFVQDLETLAEDGTDGIIREYASVFDLTPEQVESMVEYFAIWDELRVCCGIQMSKHWRNELLPKDSPIYDPKMAPHPMCGSLDIDVVERNFIQSDLYQLISQYWGVKGLDKPSLVDGDLDGTYCSRYNELVRTVGVGFNQGFDLMHNKGIEGGTRVRALRTELK